MPNLITITTSRVASSATPLRVFIRISFLIQYVQYTHCNITMSEYDRKYADPYNSHQYNDQTYDTEPTVAHHGQNTSYPDDPNPYAPEGEHPSYPADRDYPSTEKIVDDGAYGQNTERSQPGRSGLRQPPRSFAEMGPPPRSTGILRMWRKDERGKQWLRVSFD